MAINLSSSLGGAPPISQHMEDSTQFMEWALSTLQHEQPPPGTPAPAAVAYDDGCDDTVSSIPVLRYSASVESMVPGEPPAREGQRATNSWSSVDTDSGSGGGGRVRLGFYD